MLKVAIVDSGINPFHSHVRNVVRLHKEGVKKVPTKDVPCSPDRWLEEIQAAYQDAREAIPFGAMAGQALGEKELFQIVFS